MRQTTPGRENRDPLQMKLGLSSTTPSYEPKTIARYRVALVREESMPDDVPQHCGEPSAAARFLHKILSSWDREVMGAIFLDIRDLLYANGDVQVAKSATLAGVLVAGHEIHLAFRSRASP
jgi:hypothetical protein